MEPEFQSTDSDKNTKAVTAEHLDILQLYFPLSFEQKAWWLLQVRKERAPCSLGRHKELQPALRHQADSRQHNKIWLLQSKALILHSNSA